MTDETSPLQWEPRPYEVATGKELPRAIPRCEEWRVGNPSTCTDGDCLLNEYHTHPARYCPSAYCDRCNRLRLIDGETPLEPNGWLHP